MDIQQLLQMAIDRQASDLHIVHGYFPTIRFNDELFQIKTTAILTKDDTQRLAFALLTDEQKENLLANKEIDLGYEYNNYRYRVNIYYAKGGLCACLRLIATKIKTIEELMLPNIFHQFVDVRQGLILVTGQTGEGKSTTLAAVINEINFKYPKHIITIEDPVEFVYPPALSVVSQREMHQDTHSWTIALKSVLREDPDVVLVGEMRDYETIQSAITLAETGHLVFSTLHTGSTTESINRMIDVFPAHQQNQIRSQVASVLKAVISQKLVPNIDKTSRIPAIEVLLNIPAVAAIIREGRTHMLESVLETSEDQGLIIFEKYLMSLFNKGLISRETALSYAIREREIVKFMK